MLFHLKFFLKFDPPTPAPSNVNLLIIKHSFVLRATEKDTQPDWHYFDCVVHFLFYQSTANKRLRIKSCLGNRRTFFQHKAHSSSRWQCWCLFVVSSPVQESGKPSAYSEQAVFNYSNKKITTAHSSSSNSSSGGGGGSKVRKSRLEEDGVTSRLPFIVC